MRRYTVWLKEWNEPVEVEADDVDVEVQENFAFWNFTDKPQTGGNGSVDAITVAAFPFGNVSHVTSVDLKSAA